MRTSYTNLLNLYNSRLILLLIFFLSTGCQLDQSVSLIKEKLFSETDELETEEVTLKKSEEGTKNEIRDEEKNKISRKIKEIEPKKIETTKPETSKEDLSRESDSHIIQSKKKINSKTSDQVLAFKEMGKARDNESKIISFFTKIFDEKEDSSSEASDEVLLTEENDNQRIIPKDLEDNELNNEGKIERIGKTVETKNNDYEISVSSNEVSIEESLNEASLNEEDKIDEENVIEAENNFGNEESFAFLNLKPKVREKEIKEEEIIKDNLVGLLLPLTGQKSAAGNLVINSLRYSMLLKPYQLDFKIFDTKGTPQGSILAAKKGIENNVKTFIGPIFSDETREVRDFFKNKRNLTFFSLSPDLNNVSENIIVSGQNPDDQISCITKHIAENRTASKTLLIHHQDKYGEVIKNSFIKYVKDYGISESILIDFFELTKNINLNDEIRKISKFEERKLRLSDEINKVKNDKNLEDGFKDSQIKSLERKLTIDSPFDSIIIASEGDKLLEILSHLAFYDINTDNTSIYGTGLWEDTDKKDNVFKGAFFASSLKEKNTEFIQDFRNVFSKDPMSFNFHMHDLLELVQSYKTMNKKEKENKVFFGEFSNSKINSGLLQREIFIKKIRNSLDIKEVFNCRLNVL